MDTKIKFDKILEFIGFLNKFRNVIRVQKVYGEERDENDVEHSYILVMTIWYVFETSDFPNKERLDINKIIKYALIHDLVETYAGDTYFLTDENQAKTKKENEEIALKKIKEEFKEFPELGNMIEDYENKIDDEAKFVYSMDKVMDLFQFYIDGGSVIKRMESGFTETRIKKEGQIKDLEPARSLFEEYKRRIQERGVLKYYFKE